MFLYSEFVSEEGPAGEKPSKSSVRAVLSASCNEAGLEAKSVQIPLTREELERKRAKVRLMVGVGVGGDGFFSGCEKVEEPVKCGVEEEREILRGEMKMI